MRPGLHACLLTLLIALQSVMAMANIYPCEQAEELGLYYDLDQQRDCLDEIDTTSAKNASVNDTAFTEDNCLNCTDCSCCLYLSLPDHVYTSTNDPGQLIDNNDLSMTKTPRFLLLRPPKS